MFVLVTPSPQLTDVTLVKSKEVKFIVAGRSPEIVNVKRLELGVTVVVGPIVVVPGATVVVVVVPGATVVVVVVGVNVVVVVVAGDTVVVVVVVGSSVVVVLVVGATVVVVVAGPTVVVVVVVEGGIVVLGLGVLLGIANQKIGPVNIYINLG